MKLTQFAVDDGPQIVMDCCYTGVDGDQQVTGFVSMACHGRLGRSPTAVPEGGKAFIVSSTMRLASATSQRSNRSSHPNTVTRPGVQSPVPVCGRSII